MATRNVRHEANVAIFTHFKDIIMEWEPEDPLRLVVEDAGVETLQEFMELDYDGTALMEYSVFSDPDPTTGARTESRTVLTKPQKNLLRISIAFAIARTTNPDDGNEPGRYEWYDCDGDDFEAFCIGNSGYTATKTFTEWRDSCRAEYLTSSGTPELTPSAPHQDKMPPLLRHDVRIDRKSVV